MTDFPHPLAPLKLSAVFRLRCPHCNDDPLRAPGSWLRFREGCAVCRYRYERDEGYFWGASWMISYTVVGLVCMVLGVILLRIVPDWRGEWIALIISLVAVPMAFGAQPYGKALWIFIDHWLHPLEGKDVLISTIFRKSKGP